MKKNIWYICLASLFLFISCDNKPEIDDNRDSSSLIINMRSIKEKVVANVKDDILREGEGSFGLSYLHATGHAIYRNIGMLENVAHLVGNKVIKGSSPYGEVFAVIENDYIHEGNSKNGLIAGRVERQGREREYMAAALGAVFILLELENLYHDWPPTKIFSGESGEVIALVNDGNLIIGDSPDGEKIAHIRYGNSITERRLFLADVALFDENKVIKGKSEDGEIIALIDGNKVIKGNSKDGEVIATIEREEIRAAALAAYYLLIYKEKN